MSEEDSIYHISWDEMPFIALDTETTGFRKSDRIVELGMVMIRDGEVIDTYQTFLNPGFPMPEAASYVNGITDDMLADAPVFEDVRADVMDWLCRGAPWVAHNAKFDMRMLSYDLPFKMWPTGIPTLCTLQMAQARGHRKAKLSDLAMHYGIPQEDAHRAVDDARVCGLIATHLTKGFTVSEYLTKYSEEWG